MVSGVLFWLLWLLLFLSCALLCCVGLWWAVLGRLVCCVVPCWFVLCHAMLYFAAQRLQMCSESSGKADTTYCTVGAEVRAAMSLVVVAATGAMVWETSCTPPPPLRKHGHGPKKPAKQRFNAHPVLRQDRACKHT
jgi:hypothetical protein